MKIVLFVLLAFVPPSAFVVAPVPTPECVGPYVHHFSNSNGLWVKSEVRQCVAGKLSPPICVRWAGLGNEPFVVDGPCQ